MAITAQQVKELREKTGAGMMDCKNALVEADGDLEKAIEALRKKGAAVASKRAEKEANEGIIITKLFNDDKSGAILEVNCETDFVAKSDDFVNFANFVMDALISEKPASVDELKNITFNGKKVGEELSNLLGKIGEKIEISRFALEELNSGILIDYVHHGSKLGVLVKTEGITEADEELHILLKDVAMQTAAMKPLYLSKDEVPADVIEKEKEIYKEVAKKEGKPEQILDKIAEGRLNKFFDEVCLEEQAYIKENSKKVKDLFLEYNQKNSSGIKLVKFYRYHLSDEKK